MQQRQLRLGDILDDYCPRERRLTNHAVVAMVGDDVKRTRCTTCEAEHEFKQAKVPRQRRKTEPAALFAQVAVAPKRVVHEVRGDADAAADTDAPADTGGGRVELSAGPAQAVSTSRPAPGPVEGASMAASDESGVAARDEAGMDVSDGAGIDAGDEPESAEDGPVHRTLIRAQLPRHEGQVPIARQAPDFTIRQPAGRQNRFRPRFQHAGQGHGQGQGQGSYGNRPDGNMAGNARGGAPRPAGGRPPMTSRLANRHGGGGKRSK